MAQINVGIAQCNYEGDQALSITVQVRHYYGTSSGMTEVEISEIAITL